MPASIMIIIIVGALIGLSLVVGYIFSSIVLYARRQPVVKTPEDYDLDYEEVEFKGTDGVNLKGWYIPVGKLAPDAEPREVIILTHPMTFNRQQETGSS